MATNTNVNVNQVAVLGGANNDGVKIGYIDSAAKAAQNDTWTLKNVSEIKFIVVTDDSAGTADDVTISSNVVTLTGAATGAASAFVVYR